MTKWNFTRARGARRPGAPVTSGRARRHRPTWLAFRARASGCAICLGHGRRGRGRGRGGRASRARESGARTCASTNANWRRARTCGGAGARTRSPARARSDTGTARRRAHLARAAAARHAPSGGKLPGGRGGHAAAHGRRRQTSGKLRNWTTHNKTPAGANCKRKRHQVQVHNNAAPLAEWCHTDASPLTSAAGVNSVWALARPRTLGAGRDQFLGARVT